MHKIPGLNNLCVGTLKKCALKGLQFPVKGLLYLTKDNTFFWLHEILWVFVVVIGGGDDDCSSLSFCSNLNLFMLSVTSVKTPCSWDREFPMVA